jgi:DNA ligase 1
VDEELITNQAEELRIYHKQKLAEGLEGVVIKQWESVYEPGRRGWSWVKFKEVENSQAKLSDTIDAVVMGFYRGKGKRTGFGIGAFLVGLRNLDGNVVTLAKVGTGLTDEQWKEMRKRLETVVSVSEPKGYVVDKGMTPDVWVDPAVVVEIAADEITKSPTHTAGYALRFPRLIDFRDDKSVDQITTSEELARIKETSTTLRS